MERTAEIIVVGDEVLAGEVADANGPFLLATLAEMGTKTNGLQIVPDAMDRIVPSVREARERADVVLITGGIGPTHDDCTRPAVAAALDLDLVLHADARDRLRSIFKDGATEEEMAMAHLPRGAEILTSPESYGFAFRVDSVFVFPGVPRLLVRLFLANQELLMGSPWVRREVSTHLREGVVAKPFADLARGWPLVKWGSYPDLTPEGWKLRLVLRARDEGEAAAALAALEKLVGALGRKHG